VTAKWEAITTNPVYINRKSHSANIYKNKMYTFSGVNTGGVLNNQLWCLDFGK